MLKTEVCNQANHTPIPGIGVEQPLANTITYTFDKRAFIVQPVFKDKSAHPLSAALLRLMRADLEES